MTTTAASRSRSSSATAVTLKFEPFPANGQRDWFEAIWTSFGEDLEEDSIERNLRVLEPERMFGIYDGAQVVRRRRHLLL